MTRRTLLLGLGALAALSLGARAQETHDPISVLIITGDHAGHDWKATTEVLKGALAAAGHFKVDVTATPTKDLTAENLQKYDVLLLNYKDTKDAPPDTTWTDANKEAFLSAVKAGKGLVVYHFAASAFTKPENWEEYERAICGGWRAQGFHGPAHEFTVKKTDVEHPISDGLDTQFQQVTDELYSNSVMVPGNVVLATAYCDPAKPKGTGKDEPLVWVNTYGKGRVFHDALGHSVEALSHPPGLEWLIRGVEWAATGKVCEAVGAAR